jgi:hypothetical protein
MTPNPSPGFGPRPPKAPPAALVALALGLAAGCDLTAPDSRPETLVVSPGTVELDALGAALPLRVVVRDQAGSPLPAVRATWEVEDPEVVEVDERGVVRARSGGETRIRARFGPAEGVATIMVRPRPAEVQVEAGADQTARAGDPLPTSLSLRLTDRLGTPLAGLPWTLDLQATGNHGGSALPSSGVTGPGGELELAWTLGPAPGVQSLVLRADHRTFHLTATATDAQGRVPFRIRVRPLGAVSPEVMEAAERAASRWSSLMEGKLAPLLARAPAGRCGSAAPALDEVVDDLLVFISEGELDGPGGAAAVAGPCFVREEGLIPVVGRIVMDQVDVPTLRDLELLDEVVAHELGHVLGIGTLWPLFDLLREPSLPDRRGADTHFVGPLSIQAFDASGGAGYPGARVPVENELGAEGVRDGHWRQSVFGVELMNPFLVAGVSNPLSSVTAASLADLGYPVRAGAGDPWSLPAMPLEHEDPVAVLHLLPGVTHVHRIEHLNRSIPLHVLGEDGRIVQSLRIPGLP